ncbi:hypothetical protein HMPREF1503_0016 [Olsenella uli MSTE5]|nr:hypothetical protein HMPREF1503_0016 [Olsenella uli MSTE5]
MVLPSAGVVTWPQRKQGARGLSFRKSIKQAGKRRKWTEFPLYVLSSPSIGEGRIISKRKRKGTMLPYTCEKERQKQHNSNGTGHRAQVGGRRKDGYGSHAPWGAGAAEGDPGAPGT